MRLRGLLGVALIGCAVAARAADTTVLADFEGPTYGDWVATGTAFGAGPAHGTLPGQQEVGGFVGGGLVNSFLGGDGPTGQLTSPLFRVDRRFITFLIGGGALPGKTGLNLLVGGKVVRTATGTNSERLAPVAWDVADLGGKLAQLQIVDSAGGGWGHINVDQIVLADQTVLALEPLRVWTRTWDKLDLPADQPLTVPLRFHFVPTGRHEPNGGFEPATGTDRDVLAEGYEVGLELTLGQARQVELGLCGSTLLWDRDQQTLAGQVPLPARKDRLTLWVVWQPGKLQVLAPDGQVLLDLASTSSSGRPELTLAARGGAARLEHMELLGLRGAEPTPEEAHLAAIAARDSRVFYRSESYTVYGGRVEDRVYGPPAAYVPDSHTIVSPTRVIESFRDDLDVWRPRPQARVTGHATIWHPNNEIGRFPTISTGWPTVDAACRVALDVLQRCGGAGGEFANNPGEVGLWEAGFFWGPGNGFGIWLRDSTHVALRAGNLLDPATARRTLAYTTRQGIDNGVDGVAMPMVGLWDNYLVTGDDSVVRERWEALKARLAQLDAQFDPNRGLIRASHSTSNDFFPEPEAGGFALGTETYYLLAYQAMAELGRAVREDEALTRRWAERADLLRATIRKLYWKESAGFFTTGPAGSEGHAHDFWESSGQEAAIWPRFGIATPEQRRRVLDALPRVALNEFGVNVFPYRPETNHFCNAAWVAWTAGMAAAAGREGRLDLLQQLIGQQVRNAVINKTFYEVIDYRSGRAWRWPGQLWQAAGFLSYFYYGVLGLEYDTHGLTLHPAIPEPLADLQVFNLTYRQAVLDVSVQGWGTAGAVRLDGAVVDHIPTNLHGRHAVTITMDRTAVDAKP